MRRACAIAITVVVVAVALAPASIAQDPPGRDEGGPSARILGAVRDGEGARVLAYHVDTSTLFASEPVGRDGKFVLEGLPRGIFDLAVETDEGLYVSAEIVHLAPASKIAVELRLVPYPPEGPPPGRERFAGSDEAGIGLARFEPRLSGKAFWKSPKGLAVIGGVGAGALLWLALSEDSGAEPIASPIN